MDYPTVHMVRIHPDAILPVRAHETDAAWDLFIPEKVIIPPGERRKVSTGWKVGIVPNYINVEYLIDSSIFQFGNEDAEEILDNIARCEEHSFVWQLEVRPRSSMANKFGVTVGNSPGTIDNGYRGPLEIILVNHSAITQVFEAGAKVAQMVLTKAYLSDLVESESFPDKTPRGEGGFGSTGE